MYQPMKVTTLNGPDGDVVLSAVPEISNCLNWPKGMFHIREARIPREKYDEGGGSNKRGIVWVDFSTGECLADPPVSSVLEFMGVDVEAHEVGPEEPDNVHEGEGEQTVIKTGSPSDLLFHPVEVPKHGDVWDVDGRTMYFTYMKRVRGHSPCMVGVYSGLNKRRPSDVWSMEEWETYLNGFSNMDVTRKRPFGGRNVKEINMRVFGPRKGEIWIRRTDREEIRIDKVVLDRFKYEESDVFYTNLATSRSSVSPVSIQYIWYKHVCIR